jgi:4-hydroxy-3-polyprenylbenzoate decarboxylase
MGVRLLQVLRAEPDVETHLVGSPAAIRTLDLETPEWTWARVKELAHHIHDHKDIAAGPASGSFTLDAMVVIPASMHTCAAIAYGLADNLLVRAADVMLKERRNLIVVPRETPLHEGHLETLTRLARLGACVLPPVIAFYHHPKTVEDIVDHTIGKVMDQLGFAQKLFPRWVGPRDGSCS